MTHVTRCHDDVIIMTSGHRQVPACLPRPRLDVWRAWPDLETLRSNQINPRPRPLHAIVSTYDTYHIPPPPPPGVTDYLLMKS